MIEWRFGLKPRRRFATRRPGTSPRCSTSAGRPSSHRPAVRQVPPALPAPCADGAPGDYGRLEGTRRPRARDRLEPGVRHWQARDRGRCGRAAGRAARRRYRMSPARHGQRQPCAAAAGSACVRHQPRERGLRRTFGAGSQAPYLSATLLPRGPAARPVLRHRRTTASATTSRRSAGRRRTRRRRPTARSSPTSCPVTTMRRRPGVGQGCVYPDERAAPSPTSSRPSA